MKEDNVKALLQSMEQSAKHYLDIVTVLSQQMSNIYAKLDDIEKQISDLKVLDFSKLKKQ